MPDDLKAVMKSSLHHIMESYQYVNLLCMVQHFYNPYKQQMEALDSRMTDWGEFAIHIFDVGVFLGKLCDYAKAHDDYFLAGPIEYMDESSDWSNADCFCKSSGYSYQHEWRVAYLSDVENKKKLAKETPFTGPYSERLNIDVGYLSDCADIIPSKVVFNDLESVYNGLKIAEHIDPVPKPQEPSSAVFYDNEYFGWGERQSFRELVQQIDGGNITSRFNI